MSMKNVRSIGGAWLLGLFLTACGGGGGDDGVGPVPDDTLAVPTPAMLCGTLGVTPRIRNGTVCAQPERSPVVPLFVTDTWGGVGLCSGTVVGPRQVMTAAHCLSSGVRAVSVPLWDNDQVSDVMLASRWVVHPGFRTESTGYFNDVAVVTFAADLPNPSMALLTSAAPAAGQRVYLAGWGEPPVDLAVGYAVLSVVRDAQIGYVYDGVTSNTCIGDSGGPAFRMVNGQPAVVGITSTGTEPSCLQGDEALFTRIQSSSVLSFLRREVTGLKER